MSANSGEPTVYVGTYAQAAEEGIHIYKLDNSGTLQRIGAVRGEHNPSFLAIHPSGRYLYAVNEVNQWEGRLGGAAAAYAISAGSGSLTFLNRQSCVGTGPCHVSLDHTGKYVFVANYSGGSVAVLPVLPDGSLAPAGDFVQHTGSGPDKKRQEGPHAHSSLPDPTNRFVCVADLGLDKLMVYALDLDQGHLIPHTVPAVEVAPGAGPRHFTFHANSRFLYLINELDNTICVYRYRSDQGSFTHLQTVPALPSAFTGVSHCADIHLHPSGRFLYGSNRGHDSLVVYSVNDETGQLTYITHVDTQGKNPRNFAIDPSGRFLLVAHQDSNTVVSFRIDQATGGLTPTGSVAVVSKPVCIQFLM